MITMLFFAMLAQWSSTDSQRTPDDQPYETVNLTRFIRIGTGL